MSTKKTKHKGIIIGTWREWEKKTDGNFGDKNSDDWNEWECEQI